MTSDRRIQAGSGQHDAPRGALELADDAELEEIELLAELMILANRAGPSASVREIDHALGLTRADLP